MPEYLAPGVYVEETSFRSKSIEGVSTSTTAFVGPTRKGPTYNPDKPSPDTLPELLTSFGDFERIYGGLDDLSFGTNYLAHAVKAYFDNGGSRLFVSRVFQTDTADGLAASPLIDKTSTGTEATLFRARTPGSAGNGVVRVRQVTTPATELSLKRAPEGSMVRIGGGTTSPATKARLLGAKPPFALPTGGKLLLTAGATDVDVEIKGTETSVTGEAITAPFTVTQAAGDHVLDVMIDGVPQLIPLITAQGATTATFNSVADIVALLNRELHSGYAEVTGGGNDQIRIASDRRGKAAMVKVRGNSTLGFVPETGKTHITATGTDEGTDNNVNDVWAITADELGALVGTLSQGKVSAGYSPEVDRLVLTSADEGETAVLTVRDGDPADDDVAKAFGFQPNQTATGMGTEPVQYYMKRGGTWLDGQQSPKSLDLGAEFPTNGTSVHGADIITLSVVTMGADGNETGYEGLGFDDAHPRWVGHALAKDPTSRLEMLQGLAWMDQGTGVSAFELRDRLFATGEVRDIWLTGGFDGAEPTAAAYERGLKAIEQNDDVSIVAAPGGSAYQDAQGIMNALVTHADGGHRYRIAVLDTPPGQTVTQAKAVRSQFDSTHAAMYYPWVTVPNPLTRPGDESIPRELTLPPSGFVCGIYARSDVEHGVYKAPANEVVRGALRFETDINFAQQELLNPLGVNCLRFFPGRGYRVWGARTASSDPEWKYVNIRRYFNYLERSIDRGTQWAVFEPNGERLWDNIRQTISDFLYNEWVSGALLGADPKQAFFVRCDRSTMTQNDLDNGRLICLVGVAAIKPAEFVIFRIGQKTADARS